DFGLVGIDQPPFLPVEAPQPPLPFLLFGPIVCLLSIGLAGESLELRKQGGGVVEQPLDVLPHGGFQFVRRDAAPRAAAVAVHSVLAVALVVAMLGPAPAGAVGDAKHGQAAGPAGQQAAEQVVVALVVPEGQGRVPGQLRRRLLMGLFIDDSRDGDGDPLLARARAGGGPLPGARGGRAGPARGGGGGGGGGSRCGYRRGRKGRGGRPRRTTAAGRSAAATGRPPGA